MSLHKRIDIKAVILKFLEEKKEVHLRDIAKKIGFSEKDSRNRRAIQRAFACLVEEGSLQPQGQARARSYILKNKKIIETQQSLSTAINSAFQDIPLSEESIALLRYLSQSIHARQVVGYKQEFLRSYKPNQSEYLNHAVRKELLILGRSEHTVRPAGTYARNILNRLLIDLSWNSSRLEGNTYSLLETKRLIELGESASGKDTSETQMILNHKEAIEYIIESVYEEKISLHEICSIHALLSENLLGDLSASGRIRVLSVRIAGTTYLPLENPQVLRNCCEMFVEKINAIKDPFEQSFFSLVHLSYLQAFEDVNKRTARLVANIPLIRNNLNPLSFTDMSQQAYITSLLGVYEKNDISLLRDLYRWAYKRSAQRYSAIQQNMGAPNLLKLKYRTAIHEIIRTLVLKKITGQKVVSTVRDFIKALNPPADDAVLLHQIIETEIMSLHEGNIARFKLRPSEFLKWKNAKE